MLWGAGNGVRNISFLTLMHDSNYEALTQISCRPARVKCVGSCLMEMDTGEDVSDGKGSSQPISRWHIHETWLKMPLLWKKSRAGLTQTA